jgi:hypothetical protein
MNNQFSKKGLMTALGAGVLAASSFAAVNAYAACVVCWSPNAQTCTFWAAGVDALTDGEAAYRALMDSTDVMWQSCYENSFRSQFEDTNGENGAAVDRERCMNAPGLYKTFINFEPHDEPNPSETVEGLPYPKDGEYAADSAVWFEGKSCLDLKREQVIQANVPLAADSIEYNDLCLVTNKGTNNETVTGIGELAPGATGLLPGACPQ